MRLDTEGLIYNLSGKNKSFISRVAKQQEEKYGNVDIFDANIRSEDDIEVGFGDYWIRFFFDDKGEVKDTLGTGQGHKYHASLESCAKELRQKYIDDTIV